MTPADIVVVIPMLGRPHHIGPLLASLDTTAPAARVLFCVSPADRAVHQCIDAAGRERITVAPQPHGDYARKIQAGYEATSEPLIFLGASDLEFRPGWAEAAIAQLASPRIGVVGTNDLGSPRVMRGAHSTHSLVTRAYVDRFGILQPGPRGRPVDQPGTVLFDGYVHEFVDDELVGTARARRAYAHAHQSHVLHKHPDWDASIPRDDLYAQQQQRMAESAPLYQSRRRLWARPLR